MGRRKLIMQKGKGQARREGGSFKSGETSAAAQREGVYSSGEPGTERGGKEAEGKNPLFGGGRTFEGCNTWQ